MSALRPADHVMRLARLGASHQTRLSFMRVVLRHLKAEGWQFDRPVFDIDASGVGRAVYRAIGPQFTYSLVAFADDLPDHLRSDRVIATRWDATFALFDGTPDTNDLDRLAEQVPLQEAGRVSDRELVLSRANRSARLWEHVVESLSTGLQPDIGQIEAVGYLMRTTAVYGSGKFGAADREVLIGRPLMGGPFRAEMLAVFLIRAFAADLVEHMAKAKGGDRAVPLDPQIRKRLGIGNSTGLGMAPFLVNHPLLLDAWMSARETAFSRVLGLRTAEDARRIRFLSFLPRAGLLAEAWTSRHPLQLEKVAALKADLAELRVWLRGFDWEADYPWRRMQEWSEANLSLEGQELLLSLMLEPYGDIVDDLAGRMAADELSAATIRGNQTVEQLRAVIERCFSWVRRTDYSDPNETARFWYVSEDKLEPRLGERREEPGSELEQPLDIARQVVALSDALNKAPGGQTVADFLSMRPAHRRAVRRVQFADMAAYSEIHDNLVSGQMLPIDLLRSKLAFFGATHFDPRSDRWVRITMYQNAPYPHELDSEEPDDWAYPKADASS